MTTKFAIGMLVLGACAVPELGTKQQADTGCVDGAESYIDENGDEVICVYTDDPGDTDPCTLDPSLCNPDPCVTNPDACDPCVIDPSSCDPCVIDPSSCSGGGTGVCASRTKKATVEVVNDDKTKAEQQADTAAVNQAQNDCLGDYYNLVPPTYCGDGSYDGFQIDSSSCVWQDASSVWDCSTTAEVTCNYTFHWY